MIKEPTNIFPSQFKLAPSECSRVTNELASQWNGSFFSIFQHLPCYYKIFSKITKWKRERENGFGPTTEPLKQNILPIYD